MKHFFFLTLMALALWANATKMESPSLTEFGKTTVKSGFEENIGQITGKDAKRVKFRLDNGSSTIFLLETAIAYQFTRANSTGDPNKLYESVEEKMKHMRYATYRMDMQLVGANPHPTISKSERLTHFNRYSSAGMEKAHFYEKIVYHNVYPKIDWVFFINESGIKHEFIVHPGGNPNLITFEAKWVENLQLDKKGNLVLENRLGKVIENKPISLQGITTIETHFVLQNQQVTYHIEEYNKNEALIIDPQVIWGTYYGGPGADGASSVSTDNQGNVYFCGSTQSFTGIADGGFLNVNTGGGAFAAFLVKFNPAGQRLWATYYGTMSFITSASACATDQQGNVYMAGATDAINGVSFNGQQNFLAGSSDGYLVKFAPDGQRIWATYYGGSQDDGFDALTIDDSDNIYVAGGTLSPNFPLLNPSQSSPGENIGSGGDASIVKFNTQGQVLYSTFLGGSGGDRIFGITHNSSGDIFVCGRTTSSNFPVLNAHQSTNGSVFSTPFDGFLSKFNSSGNMLWSTYYGGSDSDVAYSVAADQLGNVYLSGNTGSQNNIAAGGFQNSIDLGSASFLAKFNANGLRQWGTYYGFSFNDFGSNANFGWGCATDSDNNVYLVGRTVATENVAFQGFQNQPGGSSFGSDGYIVKFNGNGSRLWATYYGGENNDDLRGCHIDPANQLYVAGSSNSPNNIFFQGFQSTQESDDCIVAKIGCPTPTIFNLPQEICANSSLQINLFPSGGALQLTGGGTLVNNTYTAPNVSELTNVELSYTINASNQCPGLSNTFSFAIRPNIIPNLSIEANRLEICEGEEIVFNALLNNSGENPTITWFVNNEPSAQNTLAFSSSSLSNDDQVQCIVQSTVICANPETVTSNTINITVNPNPSISLFFSDINGGALVASPGFTNYQWFLNGNVIEDANSSFLIPEGVGVYTLFATNEFGCTSSAETNVQIVTVVSITTSEFQVFPNPVSRGWMTLETGINTTQKISLYNSIGVLVFETVSVDSSTNITTEDLASGIYLLTVDVHGKRQTKKIVIKNE